MTSLGTDVARSSLFPFLEVRSFFPLSCWWEVRWTAMSFQI